MSVSRWLARSSGAVILVAGAVLVGNWLLTPGILPLRDIALEGDLQRADRSQLWSLLRPHSGANFIRLRLGDVKAGLLADPWVEGVTVQRVWPDRLIVRVKERTPVARWGEDSLIDRNGVRFAGDGSARTHLPLLQGPAGSEKHLLATYGSVQGRLGTVGLEVRALIQDSRRAWRIVLRDGMELDFGRQAFEERLDRFAKAYPGLLASRADAVAAVDLRYSNGFAVRWRRPDGGQPG